MRGQVNAKGIANICNFWTPRIEPEDCSAGREIECGDEWYENLDRNRNETSGPRNRYKRAQKTDTSTRVPNTNRRILDDVAEHTKALHSSTLHIREIEKGGPAAILLGDELLEYAASFIVPRPIRPSKTRRLRDRRRSHEVRNSVLVTRRLVHPASQGYTFIR